jgi:hypothetical protein
MEVKESGRAYAIFNCNAPRKKIETELLPIRKSTKTPKTLELRLTEAGGIENLENLEYDDGLKRIIEECITGEKKPKGEVFVLEANYKKATNRETADELVAIQNQAYQSSLYKNKEDYYGEIVYEEGGEYLFI